MPGVMSGQSRRGGLSGGVARRRGGDLQGGVGGYVGQEEGGEGGVVYLAAAVLQAIADNEIVGVERKVIGVDLLEDGLRDGHGRGFVFNNHVWAAACAVVEHAVAAPCDPVDLNTYFVGEQGGGVAHVVDEVVGKMLSHPLFRGQPHVFSAQGVEDLLLAPGCPVEAKREGREVERLHEGVGVEWGAGARRMPDRGPGHWTGWADFL